MPKALLCYEYLGYYATEKTKTSSLKYRAELIAKEGRLRDRFSG